jgi:hypothetical protein
MDVTTTTEQYLDPLLMSLPLVGGLAIGVVLAFCSAFAGGVQGSKQGYVILGAGGGVILMGVVVFWWLATGDPSGVHAAQ